MNRGAYAGILALCLFVALAAGWTTLATQVDNDVYDFLFRIRPYHGRSAASVIYGIDERSLSSGGGVPGLRRILAEGMDRVAACEPGAVIVDLILADATSGETDQRLAAAMGRMPRMILATDLTRDGWEDPLALFPRTALGHVHADPDPYDNVLRQVSLEKTWGRERRWALSFEALRAMEPGLTVEESPEGLVLGGVPLEARRTEARPLLIQYRPPDDPVPQITFHELAAKPARCSEIKGKAVFVGLTAQSAAQDRHMTPYSFGQTMPGVEIHANAYETLRGRRYLKRAGNLPGVALAALWTLAAGLIFYFLTGWTAYLLAVALLGAAHLAPYAAFGSGVVLPYTAPVSAAWFSSAGAASFQYFATRRRLRKAETEREGYRQAIHFVAHEMRSPLTAIQGSSELMSRYNLPEAKRDEIATMINAESKRLGKMIQTFLDVERLSAGQMELKRERFSPAGLAAACVDRVRPLAERKRITLQLELPEVSQLVGDRELMEYAIYNLLTNAIKYSPPETTVRIGGEHRGGRLRLWVRDQGIGMDADEVRNVFTKFYRTRKAERSGEAGTGIGLSIVEQIVGSHGGRMEVESAPGAGSCFTMDLPLAASAEGPTE